MWAYAFEVWANGIKVWANAIKVRANAIKIQDQHKKIRKHCFGNWSFKIIETKYEYCNTHSKHFVARKKFIFISICDDLGF